jgi:exodeoxyribonuclease VII large subunit
MNPTFTVSDFVAVFNQTLEYAYPTVSITGELSNFRVSKGKWVYFDLKDDTASVRFFGTVYMLPGPLEDGMLLQVEGVPRLHPTFGFSITAQSLRPVGEGSLKKAAALLEAKLTKEGLFAEERKRSIPYPPARIGLIASGESAAYVDFMKILAGRWGGIEIVHVDSQVQGAAAPAQIIRALDALNAHGEELDAIVITRGGGSADDLQAFNVEQVVRAIAASRIPTLVAIGHEVDTSLAERAADKRASTPSNAAELLVPDRSAVIAQNSTHVRACLQTIRHTIHAALDELDNRALQVKQKTLQVIANEEQKVRQLEERLQGYDPRTILKRGYARIANANKESIRSVDMVAINESIIVRLSDGAIDARVEKIRKMKGTV